MWLSCWPRALCRLCSAEDHHFSGSCKAGVLQGRSTRVGQMGSGGPELEGC